MEESMRREEDQNGSEAAKEVIGAVIAALANRLAGALEPAVVAELSRHIAKGRFEEVADYALRNCADALSFAADRLNWPGDSSWEESCARCGGLGRCGIKYVSRCASTVWSCPPPECINPDGCGWPDDPSTRAS